MVGFALDPGNSNCETLCPTNYTLQYLSLGAPITITTPQEGNRGSIFTYGITAVLAAYYHYTQGLAGVRKVGHEFMEGEGGEIDEALCD